MLRVLESLAFLLVIPYAASRIVLKIHPAAREWPKKVRTATFSLWSITLFIIATTAAEFFQKNPDISLAIVGKIALIALLICAANFAIGHWVGEKNYKREASQSLGQKNTSLTIYLAITYTSPAAALGPVFYIFFHNLWNAIQLQMHKRK